ncbi:flagellar M-ring protein FliF [Anaerotignum faecicola]|nr:flagellar M-ring protein FliF [Anaerotignum faecicola]
MNERLKAFLEKAKETLSKLSSKTKKIIIIGLAVSVIASVGIAVWLNNRPYEVLFSGLNDQEASEIMGKLQSDGVEYKYETGGTILVPQEQEEQLKAQLVYEGYPKSGFTYGTFTDNIDLTTTQTEMEHYKMLDLQERMGATISLFPNIKEARVTIAPGEEKKYVLDKSEDSQASASVTVVTDDGNDLEEEQVEAIQRLISKSIPNVEFSRVGVICNGKDVTIDEENGSRISANELKFKVEDEIDRKIKNKILDMLIPIYGEEHVKVSVKSEVDINKKIRELINYSGEDEENKGVLSSQSATQEIAKDGEQIGGVPGTETNADIPIYTTIGTDGNETYILSDGTANYLVDQLKQQEQVDAGDLVDLTVAVIIDGDEMSDATRDDITSLVGRAAGISADIQDEKIEIMAVPFYQENIPGIVDDATGEIDMQRLIMIAGIAAGGLVLILIIILIVLAVRKKRKKKKQRQQMLADQGNLPLGMEDLPSGEPEGLDAAASLLNIKNERSMELKNKIRDITEENPEVSAQILKSWLRGGNNNG